MSLTQYYTATTLDGFIRAEWKWPYDIPCWVFTHRQLPVVPDSGIAFTSADIATVYKEMVGTAGDGNVWIVGGGDLAGQFADAGLLDEVIVSIAPVTLGGGALGCPAGSSCDWTSSDGTATSPAQGSPWYAHPPDVGRAIPSSGDISEPGPGERALARYELAASPREDRSYLMHRREFEDQTGSGVPGGCR